jgi:cell division protein FtsW
VLAGTGLVAQIGGQAFINILVNLQLFPSKGMTLPLISYGGSSTIALCMGVGFLLAITRRNPYLAHDPFASSTGQRPGLPLNLVSPFSAAKSSNPSK